MNLKRLLHASILGTACMPLLAVASSHREAPIIGGLPRVDATDFYMFRSYEPGRANYVTFIANYIPFQDPQGGPNFYPLDTGALYAINVDNRGTGTPDLIFEFRFRNQVKNLTVPSGGHQVAVPLLNIGAVDPSAANLNVVQSYTVSVVTPGGGRQSAQNVSLGSNVFYRPADNIGHKSIPDYPAYAAGFVYQIGIPGCAAPGRVFVGQRKESFFIDVGDIFDLVNLNPVGARDGNTNDLTGKNVTSIALEVPINCVISAGEAVIGAYTTASMRDPRNPADTANYQQVSRLGMPLVNEVVIGLKDKDKFNESQPSDDGQFLQYVANPSLPILLHALFGAAANVPGVPRNDLVSVYLTGVKNLNQPKNVTPSEMLRLNTAAPPTPAAQQNDLGVLAGDVAGFPNGRRPYDDVVDISLRVVEGHLCGAVGNCGALAQNPNPGILYTDGVRAAGPDAAHLTVTGSINALDTYLPGFPYLMTPIPGSPQGAAQ